MAYGHTSHSPHTAGGDELMAGRGGTNRTEFKNEIKSGSLLFSFWCYDCYIFLLTADGETAVPLARLRERATSAARDLSWSSRVVRCLGKWSNDVNVSFERVTDIDVSVWAFSARMEKLNWRYRLADPLSVPSGRWLFHTRNRLSSRVVLPRDILFRISLYKS
ncbi:unnamed protein product [Euphydryas editha]|uniref:Uncharacterized protein n=1 Tax=Euphydryas editha TaxID=104508 RepID=A0AAU9TFQ8_EUPED|nr:unnamed protein product [Euphydryas editha]